MDESLIQTVIGTFGKKMNRQLLYYLDVCVRCAICKDACHQYVVTGDVRYLPAYRAEILRKIYKKYFTRAGAFMPALYEAEAPSDPLLDELFHVTYACTGCRRCMYYCPFSIDTSWMLATSKALLIAAGRGEPMLTQLADVAVMKADDPAMFRDTIATGYAKMAGKLREETGDPDADIPFGRKGARMLYVPLAGAHTIVPAARIFNHAGEDWTLCASEASNYGYFLGDVERARKIAKRIVDEAVELGVEEVVITECGHAYRIMKMLYEAWSGQELPFRVSLILDVLDRYLAEGRISVDAAAVSEPITYHDPCQFGRNGGIYDQPRRVLRAIASDLRELSPNRERNWCCGGGGGLVAITEMDELRLATGAKKIEQTQATGARLVATPCENCRLQLESLDERYELGIEIVSVMELVADALVSEKANLTNT
jgi:Fe-S oxidoreductase